MNNKIKLQSHKGLYSYFNNKPVGFAKKQWEIK